MKCGECGVCCRLFMINLTEEEYKSGRYRTLFEEFDIVDDFEEAELCAANIIRQNDDESCIYLKDNKCSIHDKRPQSCRNFFCELDDNKFSSMIEKIKRYKAKSRNHKK